MKCPRKKKIRNELHDSFVTQKPTTAASLQIELQHLNLTEKQNEYIKRLLHIIASLTEAEHLLSLLFLDNLWQNSNFHGSICINAVCNIFPYKTKPFGIVLALPTALL